jgi:hypothetical protein
MSARSPHSQDGCARQKTEKSLLFVPRFNKPRELRAEKIQEVQQVLTRVSGVLAISEV